MISNIFDDYAAVQSVTKYTSHLIHFCYLILELTLHYQEKTQLNSTIMWLYQVVPYIRQFNSVLPLNLVRSVVFNLICRT